MSDPITRLNAALEGRYAIERELGEGGMATVYLADDIKHERKVALKVLKPELAAVVGAERFLAEIKTTANLTHPHILPLHDSGEADSFLFYVMPHIEGESLRERIDREKQLGVDDSVAITQKVAGALDYAHGHGVVHRDIKPGNILLSEQGEPLVADFGIALAVAQAGAGRITETGLSLGTPHYMSPEQATGDRDVDPRSDVYALGCVLYEMLAGQPPFSATTAQAVLVKILTADAPSITSERRTVPPHVGHALAQALEKLPADRFSSAAEFAAALGDESFMYKARARTSVTASTPEPVPTRAPATMPGPWKRLTIATTTLAALFAVAFAWSFLRREPPQPVTRQVLSMEGLEGLDAPVGQRVALAPDGSSMILPRGSSDADVQLAVKMRGSKEFTPISGTERGRSVVYSPDGQWIAYVVGGELFKRLLVGGSPVKLAEDVERPPGVQGAMTALAWLDDGTILYEQFPPRVEPGLRERGIVRIPEDGGEPSVVFWPRADEPTPIWVQGLPRARGALVGGAFTAFGVRSVFVVDLTDLSYEEILQGVTRAWYAPTGHLVYVRDDGAVFAQPFDLGALKVTGGAIPLFNGVRITGVAADLQLGGDGTLLYVEGPSGVRAAADEQLVVIDLEGNQQVLPLAPRPISLVGWSPDGQSVVYQSEGQIYTYNVVLNTAPRQITFDGVNRFPVFSPDGTWVTFSSTRQGTDGDDLFAKDLNDDLPPRSIITLDGNQLMRQWPSDTLIVFERESAGVGDLWMVDLSDPENPEARQYLASEADLRNISVSLDGTLAAYRSNESGTNEIYIRSFPTPGQRTVVSRGGGSLPFWAPDGNTLFYSVEVIYSRGLARPFMAVRLQRNPVPVVLATDTLFSIETRGPFPGSALHPDGDRFILAANAAAVGETAPEGEASRPARLILVQNFFEELRQRVPN